MEDAQCVDNLIALRLCEYAPWAFKTDLAYNGNEIRGESERSNDIRSDSQNKGNSLTLALLF